MEGKGMCGFLWLLALNFLFFFNFFFPLSVLIFWCNLSFLCHAGYEEGQYGVMY